MADRFPDPLTPPECDLRGLPFMKLDLNRVLNSDLMALSSGAEFKSAFTLWARSWAQIPAGSLPTDEKILAFLSGAGRHWPRVREMALRNWVLCSDGRLYHPAVCEMALEAWDRRSDFREKTEAKQTRQQRWRERLKQVAVYLRDKGITPPKGASLAEMEALCRANGIDPTPIIGETKTSTVDAGEIGKRERERERIEEEDSVANATAQNPELDLGDDPPFDPEKVMFDAGLKLLREGGVSEARARPVLGKWKKRYGAEAVLVALGKAQRHGAIEPISFIEGALKNGATTNGTGIINSVGSQEGFSHIVDPFVRIALERASKLDNPA
jgi:hypothetical protein